MRPHRALLVSFALVTASTSSFAAPARGELDKADSLFEEAKTLMAQSRFLEACPKLLEARRIDPAAGGTLLALALCHEGEQKLATALTELRASKKMAAASGNTERQKLSDEHIAALEPHVSRLTIARQSPGAEVTLDGVALTGDTVEVDGGEHVLRAALPDRKPWESRISVATKDDARTVTIPPLEPLTAAPAPAPKPSDSHSSSALRTAGFVTGAVGVVAIGVGGYFGVRALLHHHDSRADCTGNDCGQTGFDLNDKAKTEARTSDILVGAGLAAAAAGAAMAILGGPRRESGVSAYVVPGAVGGEAYVRF